MPAHPQRRTTAMYHTEGCRTIPAEELEKVGDERLERARNKGCSSIWRKKKTKMERPQEASIIIFERRSGS